VIRAWHWFVPRMVRVWRHPLIARIAGVLLTAFFVGLVLRVVATAVGPEGADGVRDGGVAATIGNVVMGTTLVLLAPLAALFVGAALTCLALTVAVPFPAIPRAVRLRRARPAFQAEMERHVRRVLDDVGIDADAALDRRPHEFSGGQAQRISIA